MAITTNQSSLMQSFRGGCWFHSPQRNKPRETRRNPRLGAHLR